MQFHSYKLSISHFDSLFECSSNQACILRLFVAALGDTASKSINWTLTYGDLNSYRIVRNIDEIKNILK
jgi:hypothetical protein